MYFCRNTSKGGESLSYLFQIAFHNRSRWRKYSKHATTTRLLFARFIWIERLILLIFCKWERLHQNTNSYRASWDTCVRIIIQIAVVVNGKMAKMIEMASAWSHFTQEELRVFVKTNISRNPLNAYSLLRHLTSKFT